MSADWDSYLSEVNGKPALISLDLGVADDAPLPRLSVVAWVKLRMMKPRDDGLASEEEGEQLKTLEDALRKGLVWKSTAYVGCITLDGHRDYYFYTSAAQGWKEQVGGVLRDFPDYQHSCGSRPDREWDTYFELLVPDDEDRERMNNRRICDELQKRGDRLEQARPIEHSVFFPDADGREKFMRQATALGYLVIETIEPEDKGEQYGVRLVCDGVPAHDQIDALTLPLFRAAADYGGDYDGWETQVVR